MTNHMEATPPEWLDRPHMAKRVILLGGGLAASLMLAVAMSGDLIGLLTGNSVGLLVMLAALGSALATAGIRYLFDRRRARAGLPRANYGPITYGRGIFLLVHLGATAWLALLAMTSWALGLEIRVPAFQALIVVMIGGMIVSMALSAVANAVEMLGSTLSLRPRVSPPGRGGP